MLVSNQEYLEFMEEGGYREDRWLTEEGLGWRNYIRAEHPRFWISDGQNWRFRHVLHEMPMPWNWPVEVKYLEAKAFCNWKAAKTGRPVRLPAEDEWYRLYDRHVSKDQPCWETASGNLNLEHYASSCPVDEFAFGEFFDVVGNVWQWTETPITGFRGFDVHPYYDDFSTPTFDTRHNLIKGGSWMSTGNEATRDSRYAFRRHFYQHAGYDLVLAANLIDRLYAPARFLTTLHERINQGGLLVLPPPYTWLDEHTEREQWIGGFRKDGEPYTTFEALCDLLGEHFERMGDPEDIPFVIRETRRKFQHSIAQMSVWKRR